MAKYDEYSVFGSRTGAPEGPGRTIAIFDGRTFEGSYEYNCFWVDETPHNIPGWKKWDRVAYGPHTHRAPQVIYLLGSNREDPLDLGAAVEFHLGPELETFTLTRSCLIFIPANFVHGWWVIREVNKPFIVFSVLQSTAPTEKSMKELVPAGLRQNMLFVDQGYESDKRVAAWPPNIKSLKPVGQGGSASTGQYDKYIISGLKPGERDSSGKSIAHIDGDTFEGANEYWAHWAFEKPMNVPGWNRWDDITHGPHMHKFPEVVALLGTDPEHPQDLGAEFWAGMGPELVMSLVNTTRLSFLPPHFAHGPSTVKKVTRPFIFIEINQSPKHTEKALVDLVPDPGEREKMMFNDVGYDSWERKIIWPKGLGYR